MLVLRLLVMVLTIICLMDGHAEVSSSTTRIRDRRESPAVKTNEQEVETLDRKKKKKPKPKPGKKKKTKPGKKKKPNKAKPTPTKPVTTTPTVSTSTLKTTTILTSPTVATTVTTTTTTVSPTTTATTTKTTTSTASATTTLSTTTSATKTTSTITTTVPTTAATTADSGARGECKATNGKPCIFPFKDGKEYNECKNEGGKYFWCATSVYDSGKYKHWSYCSTDGPCPLEGDGECRAENNKPCVFPFKDGNKEYNECADHGGKYFWCATGTNSAGKYTAWSECPKDGSCPLSEQGTTLAMTSTATPALTTTPTNGTSAAAIAIANVENTLNEINDTLQNLETAGFSEDEKQLLETMNELSDYLEFSSLTRSWNYDSVKINSWTQKLYTTTVNIKASKEVNPGFISAFQTIETKCSKAAQKAKLSQVNAGPGRMFQLHTISEILGIITNAPSSSVCCAECKSLAADTELFEHSSYQKQCDCYKTKWGVLPQTMASANLDSGVCTDKDTEEKLKLVCPDGYSEKYNAPSFYLLKDWTYNKDAEDVYVSANICAKECKQNTKCDAVVSTVCKGCQLLTKEDSITTPREKVNHYCLYDILITRGKETRTPMPCPVGYIETEDENGLEAYGEIKQFNKIEHCHDFCNEDLSCVAVETKNDIEIETDLVTDECTAFDIIVCKRLKFPASKPSGEDKVTKFCLLPCNDIWLEKYQGVRDPIPSSSNLPSERLLTPVEKEEFTIVKDRVTWPWIAYIETIEYCTGTLISCDLVMTAQHCILDPKTYEPIPDIKVILGTFDHERGSPLSDGEFKFDAPSLFYIGSVIPGPEKAGKPKEVEDDIAILRLKTPINPLKHRDIRPIKLSTSLTEDTLGLNDLPDLTYWVIGFGKTQDDPEKGKNTKLRQTNALKIMKRFPHHKDNKNFFIKGADTEENTWTSTQYNICSGDSGGPGMIEKEDKDGKKTWFQYAVTARSYCDETTSRDHDAIMKNTYFYKKWIEQHKGLKEMKILGPFGKTSELSPQQDCSSEPDEECKKREGNCLPDGFCDEYGGIYLDKDGCDEDEVCCNSYNPNHKWTSCNDIGGVCQDKCSPCQGITHEGKCGKQPRYITCCQHVKQQFMTWQFCEDSDTNMLSRAKGFRLRYQYYNKKIDNTALNAIELLCEHNNAIQSGNLKTDNDIVWSNDNYWNMESICDYNYYLSSVKFYSRVFQTAEGYDNTGAERVDFKCTSIDGVEEEIENKWRIDTGISNWNHGEEFWREIENEIGECDKNSWICGMATQEATLSKDKRGIDQAKFQCCTFQTI